MQPENREAMTFLDEAVRRVMTAVEDGFLFRKIGLPFDYASDPNDFPSRLLASAKEARAGRPNPAGIGSGYHHSCRNHALLFDAYLLRRELGIETPGEDAILDRLIGGLIRLATVAPRSFLVGGLAPDGRGFYALPRRDNHAAWAFAAMRGMTTAAIVPETQEKFRSIAGKWLDRLRRDKFALSGPDGKPPPEAAPPLNARDPDNGPFHLAALLVGARASGENEDLAAYAAAAEEDSRVRLGEFPGREAPSELVWRQLSLALVAKFDFHPERSELAKRRLRENAGKAAAFLNAWREWDPALEELEVDLDWRRCPRVPLERNPLGFVRPESWARLDQENRAAAALYAVHIILLAGEPDRLEPEVPAIRECLGEPRWPKMRQLSALAPIPGLHALGSEMGLWDRDLFAARRVPPAVETSFAAKFLEPGYDEMNPDKAGHLAAPPGKGGGDSLPESAGRRKRRRKRK
ncbi:MAG: hypothetical protein LBU64_06410 [Planctomycetota bacterium]|jgi:hypothetical protein|nr:hypothetical protein [Planctomycetota bacterium]